jgi:ABC-type Zn uptake system ZnuABC Zn-binding protein ZnuA
VIHQKIVNVILIFVLTCLVVIAIPNFSMLNAIGALDSVLTSDTFSHKDVNTMISHVTMNLSFISSASERNPTMINASNSTGKASEKLNVVTSVSPIANIIKNIGGNRIELEELVPEGINSHTFELVPSDAIKINNADLVIIDGLGLSRPTSKKLPKKHKIKILNCRY